MSETIAHGQIQIDLNDEATLAGLRKIETQFDRTMAKIDHEEATAKIDADLAPLDDAVAKARARLRKLNGERATAKLVADKKQLDKQIKAAKTSLKRLDGERATVEIKVKGQQNVVKAQEQIRKATVARIEAVEKREQQANRLAEQAESRRMAGVRQNARVTSSLWKQRERELSGAFTAASKINDQMDRERASLPRLQREYVETARKLESLAVARRKAFGDQRAQQVVDFKIGEATAKMRVLKATLERIGGPIDLEVDIHPGRAFGSRLRAAFTSAGLPGAAHLAGMDAADKFAAGFKKRFSPTSLLGAGQRGLAKVGDVLGNLSQATVRLGPFTATIRQLGLVMAVLGPTILDVVGALGSLVGVLGSGILGAATLGAGAVTGLGLSFLGLKFSTRNTGQEIANLRTYINAVQKAQEKYGLTAGKTIKAQRELNHAMHQVSPLARETALGIEKFYTDWDKRTVATSKNLGIIAKVGFHALDQIGPMWAKRTNELSGILTTGLTSAFAYLGAGGGKGLLDSIMGSFNKSLPALLSGLGSLGKAFLNFAEIGATYLPQVTGGFARFAARVEDFTKTEDFADTVHGWMESGRNLVRFFSASGHFLTSFFSGGVKAGNSLVVTMTNALNRWDAFNRSVEGREQLGKFFQQSVTGAQQLYGVLAPIASVFVSWAANLSPVVSQFLRGAAAASNFVSQVVRLVGLQSGLGTLAATLGALWAVGKISAATRAVVGFTRALAGMEAASTAAAVANGAAGATNIIPVGGVGKAGAARAAAADAERLAPALGRVAKSGALARTVLTGLGGAIGFANPYVGAGILVAGGLALAYTKLHAHAKELKKDFEDAGTAAGRAGDAYRAGTAPLGDLSDAHKRAAISVRDARRALKEAKPGTDAYASAVLNLKTAVRQAALTQEDWTKARSDQQRAADIQVGSEEKHLELFDKINKSEIDSLKTQAKSMPFAWERARAEKELAALEAKRAPLVDRVNAALNRQAAVSANTARATQGMLPVLGSAEQKLGALARLSKSSAVKVAIKFDAPKDVGKVAASAAKTISAGTPARIVTKIIADSSNADAAVARLQAVRITPKKLAILETGGAAAVRMLQNIAGRKLSAKEQRIAQRGGDGVINLLNRILGTKFGTKTQIMSERGAAQVTAAMARILGITFPTKNVNVTANTGAAVSQIQVVSSWLASLHDRQVNVHVVTTGTGKALPRNASGRAPSAGNGMALTGEGRGPEIVANQRTGALGVVRKPTLMNLTDDDYVIPTEPKHRAKGRDLFADFARGMGIPGFKGGRKPKLPKLIGAKAADAANLKEVIAYKGIQTEEENKGKQITIAERRVKEPDTLVKQTGTDSQGNPTYGVDQSAVNAYSGQLSAVKKLQEELVGTGGVLGGIMGRLRAASANALSALGTYRNDRKKNITSLNDALTRDRKLSKNKDKDTAAAAKKRLTQEKSDITKQQTMYNSSIGVTSDINDDQQDANISRIPGYQIDLQDTTDAIIGLGAKAAAEATAANPQPQAPDAKPPGVGEPGGPTVAENQTDKLDTEKALAEAGIGVNGAPPRSIAAIDKDLIEANRAQIDEANAMLRDSDTSNDAEAYSKIQQAANAISSLTDELNNLPDSAAGLLQQTATLSTAMGDLYKSFSNNFAPIVSGQAGGVVAQGAAAGVGMSGAGSFGQNAAAPGNVATGAAGASIQIDQHFPTQPDPMTWARATKYELDSAL